MNKIVLIALLAGIPAYAVDCQTDSDCLSEGLSLIKKANKMHACAAEIRGAAMAVESIATPTELQALEDCVANAKRVEKLEKKQKQRMQRIEKAVSTVSK